MPHEILKGYTPEQVQQIKDAVYKISDAYQVLKSLSENMAAEKQWYGQGDIEHIAHVLKDQLVGDEGCIDQFLKVL